MSAALRRLPGVAIVKSKSFDTTHHISRRLFTSTPAASQRSKDHLLNRETINTESNEYSKSGGDAASAGEDPAFQPGVNDPKEQEKMAGDKYGNNPLNVSPANTDINQTHGRAEGQPGNEKSAATGAREEPSGGGSAPKAGKPK